MYDIQHGELLRICPCKIYTRRVTLYLPMYDIYYMTSYLVFASALKNPALMYDIYYIGNYGSNKKTAWQIGRHNFFMPRHLKAYNTINITILLIYWLKS